MLGKNYKNDLPHIEQPYGHTELSFCVTRPEYCYFKFAFVRNPWERLVSAFFYLNAGGCNEFDDIFRVAHLSVYNGDFNAFVLDIERHLSAQHFRPQICWLCDERGTLLPDFVGRYERLSSDFVIVADYLSLSRSIPAINSSRHLHYRDYYNPVTRKIVETLYNKDIETFDYVY